jgi:hypothetical protein
MSISTITTLMNPIHNRNENLPINRLLYFQRLRIFIANKMECTEPRRYV